jgi:tetratricopeptide (TPR) repeat protein
MVTAVALAAAVAMPQAAHATGNRERSGAPTEPEEEARAPANPQLERAMDTFRRGTTAYDEARYEQALAAFQEAATLYASPDFQYNIGLCYDKLDKPEEAIRAFETYLRTKPDAPDRANVEDRIARLRADLERAAAEPAPTEPTPQPTSQPPESLMEDVATPPSRPFIIAGAALAGVGTAVALGGGIGLGVLAKQRSDAIDDIQDGGNPGGATFDEARTLETEGKRFEALQVTFVAVGAAVALTGAALLAVGLKRRKQVATARLRVLPGVAARSGGLTLVGRF